MAFNGSGVYSLAAGNPVVTGTVISSTWANNTLNDIATGLTTALCKDGQSTPTANIKMGGFKFTGLGAGTLNGDSVRFEQIPSATNLLPIASGGTGSSTGATALAALGIQVQTAVSATTTGTAPAYVAALSPALTGLTANKTRANLTFHASNSGPVATTLDLGSGGAIGLKQYDSTGAKVDPTIVAGMMGDVEYDGTNYVLVNALPSASGVSRGTIDGLTISNGTTDPTNEIDVSAGVARNSTNTTNLTLASALTRKSLNAAWAVGATAGMRDTGAIANGTWHIFLIRRSDTGVVDVLASLSATAPTMPTNYDSFRRIGAILRESAAIVPFTQTGDYFARTTPLLDVDVTGAGSSAVTRTVAVPTGIRVLAFLNVSLKSQTTGTDGVYISDLSTADIVSGAPGGTNAAPLWTVSGQMATNSVSYGGQCSVWTNTSAQFRSRQAAGGASDRLSISALGWMDQRGKNA